MVLREHGIRRVVLAGLLTDICVYHTAVDAFELGYEVAIAEDATAAATEEEHRFALRQARRLLQGPTSCEWVKRKRSSKDGWPPALPRQGKGEVFAASKKSRQGSRSADGGDGVRKRFEMLARATQEFAPAGGAELNILECTIRDGGYAVDFQFTEADTGLLVGLLSQAGFRYVEIGHGLGLNAAKAGKGAQPASDVALIEAAKSRAAKGSLIGMFCLPGLATLDSLREAAAAGLDFLRIGGDAPVIEETLPFLAAAREAGLTVFLNLMKSYVISPEEFGRKARRGHEAGARAVYLVDSAGGMLPSDVRAVLRGGAGRKRGGTGISRAQQSAVGCGELSGGREGGRGVSGRDAVWLGAKRGESADRGAGGAVRSVGIPHRP